MHPDGRIRVDEMSTGRLEAFSDGVFAIVITLLVLELKVPDVAAQAVDEALPQALAHLWPKLLSYAISFVVVGVYWVAHHYEFHIIARVNRALLWLNVAFLMAVSFIAFSAALLGEYPQSHTALAIYGANLIVVNLVLASLWHYATRIAALTGVPISSPLHRTVQRKNLLPVVVYSVAIALAFVRPTISLALYCAVPVLYILQDRFDRYWGLTLRLHTSDGDAARLARPDEAARQ